MQALWQGVLVAATPSHLLWALAGCMLGTALGVLPGVAPSALMAALLPLTFHTEMTPALIFLVAMLCGGMYGGSTASILLNMPGQSASSVTAREGHRMALNGRAGVALATAALGSFVAGCLATLVVVVLAPWAAQMVGRLGPAEIFMLMVMALGAVCVAMGHSTLRGVTALFVGIAWACVGLEPVSGVERLTAGQPWLRDGVEVVVVVVGLLLVAQVLHAAMFEGAVRSTLNTVGLVRLSRQDCKRSWRPWLRGAAIGVPLGCVPLGGVEMPTYVSYAAERYMVRPAYQQEFGREGAIEGVAGPEAANNASVTSALIPLLVMGIPTSNATSVLLTGLHNYGITPGPQWFTGGYGLVWVLLASLLIANAMLLVLNLPLVRMWRPLLRIARPSLYACLLLVAMAGVYGLRHNLWDVGMLYVLGGLGVAMRRFDFPVTPLIVGLVLGPQVEMQLRQALAVGGGQWSIFVQQPLALGLLVAVVLLMAGPWVLRGWAQRRMAQARGMRQGSSDRGHGG